MEYHMYCPTRILFGAGVLKELHQQQLPGRKALLIISNGCSARRSGALDSCIEQLRLAGAEHVLFDRIEPNPLRETAMAGAAAARENGCDFIVALGGGSVLDCSKAIAAMARNEGDLWDYIHGGSGKGKPLTQEPLPIVAITTSAGTGSEVDAWGVISRLDTNEKIGFGGPDSLYPRIAVVDPELMLSVPKDYTAYQGFDALFHSVECYISKFANLMSDMYALTAISKIAQHLPRAVANGQDLEARRNMAFANTVSGTVMTLSCTTSEHSLEHAMSAYHHSLPHGAGLIMISLAYMGHFVKAHVCDERFIDMARAMGKKDADKAEDFLTALAELQEACGVAELKMSDYGIREEELDTIARNARETMGALFGSDPCPLNHEDCVEILRRSFR